MGLMEKLRQVSFAQQRLWFLEQLEPGTSAATRLSAIRIRGVLSTDTLALALQAIIRRHANLFCGQHLPQWTAR